MSGNQPLRIAFMGTPVFAARALQALIDGPHQVVCVYSQPPKPQGRGQKMQASPVQQLAEQHGIEVRTPRTLKTAEAQAEFAALNLDIAVVAAYGLILPPAILDAPRLGCLNIHGSLLPRWRGAAPIQRAIMAGDTETGITMMRMDAGLDTGPMLSKHQVPITATTTASELHDALAAIGAAEINGTITRYASGALALTPQHETDVTYAAKLMKAEGQLDFNKSAAELDRQIRALTPWPGTWCILNGETIKVHQAEIIPYEETASPGTILDNHLTIACNQGALRLLRVQRSGKNIVTGRELILALDLMHGN